MSFKLALYKRSYDRLKDRIKQVAPQAIILAMDEDQVFYKDGKPCDIMQEKPEVTWMGKDLFFDTNEQHPFAFIEPMIKARSLKWLHAGSHGVEHPIYAILGQQGVVLTNSDESAVAIPEFVVARVIEAFQPNEERNAAQQKREWKTFAFREIADTTWVIYGFGHIGQHVGEIVRNGFGAKVIGVRRTPGPHPAADEMMPPEKLAEAAARADVFVIAAPGVASTDNTVNEKIFKAMKPGAVFVNIGRGSIVVEDALLQGLERGTPSVAILDVFDHEPLPDDHPFWTHPRVRVTAHCAGHAKGVLARGDNVFLENLRRYAAGEPLKNIIEPQGVAREYSRDRRH